VKDGPVGIELRDAPFDGAEAQLLQAEVQQIYVGIYGGPDNTPLQVADFAPPVGAFLIADLDGETAGCAGLRRHDPQHAELKRMYVRPACRRHGVARALLHGLEERARQLGYRRLILETSLEQPEAMALYQADGYLPIENYGFHRDAPSARSFVKTL
jgi:GNAT superfamily N-acetyltransferase